MKISDTNQQINRKPELSKVDSAGNMAAKKRIEQQSKSSDTVTASAAIKTDTVQLSHESLALADSVKDESGDKGAPIQKDINENVLVELLKKADKQNGIFGPNEGISKTNGQGNSDNKSGGKIDFLL